MLEVAFAQDAKDRERSLIIAYIIIRKTHNLSLKILKKLKGTCDDLALVQKPVSDDDKVSWLGIRLRSTYMNFVDSPLPKTTLPTVSQFIQLFKTMSSKLIPMKKRK